MSAVHCAITRLVRQGKEAEFEEAVKRFVARSMSHYGTTGAHLLRPAEGTGPREFGILRSFTNEEQMNAFYDSDLFRNWQTEVAELVEGNPIRRRLHGLEAFFREEAANPPPKWKMAVITWLGVFPVVLFWSRLLGPSLKSLHPIVVTAIVTAFAVATLAWLVMPVLTKWCSSWIRPPA